MAAEGLLSTFESHAFLRGLSDRHLMLLASGAQPFTAKPGDFLAREGEPSRTFYLIQSGRVTLGVMTPDRGLVPSQVVGPGEVVGWSWVVPPHRWQFTAQAIDPVRGLAFDADWLRERCEQDHELGYIFMRHLLGVVAGRLAAARLQLAEKTPETGGPSSPRKG